MKKSILVLLACLLLCMTACGSKATSQEPENKEPDNRAFMMTIAEKFMNENFGVAKVKIKTNDFTAITVKEELKTTDGRSYDKGILATGNMVVGDQEYKFQIIAAVDDLEKPMKYTVLNFETIRPQSPYEYNILVD